MLGAGGRLRKLVPRPEQLNLPPTSAALIGQPAALDLGVASSCEISSAGITLSSVHLRNADSTPNADKSPSMIPILATRTTSPLR